MSRKTLQLEFYQSVTQTGRAKNYSYKSGAVESVSREILGNGVENLMLLDGQESRTESTVVVIKYPALY
jgi:hypothetical protein